MRGPRRDLDNQVMKPFPGLFYPLALILSGLQAARAGSVTKKGAVCTVHASANGADDGPAIQRAFELCGHDSSVVFDPTTFHIESVLNTTGLRNVFVDLPGTLLVGLRWLITCLSIISHRPVSVGC